MLMKDKMVQKLQKKQESDMSPDEQKIRLDILRKMIDQMDNEMGNQFNKVKKVTVAADSPEGLEEGLEKAQSLVAGEASEDSGEESEEVESEEGEDSMDMDAKLKELLMKKKMME